MAFIKLLEEEATQQLEAIRGYRTSTTQDAALPDLRNRAKTALGVIGAYVRLRATMANEKSNELIERRLGFDTPTQPRSLPESEADAM
jgi:hypothetical protein